MTSRTRLPKFKIACLNDRSEQVKDLVFDVPRYAPLTREQLPMLIERIRQEFPLETDFGPRGPVTRVSYDGVTGSETSSRSVSNVFV